MERWERRGGGEEKGEGVRDGVEEERTSGVGIGEEKRGYSGCTYWKQ